MCRGNAYHQQWNQYRKHGGHPAKAYWKKQFKNRFQQPPVNVQEFDDKYELHLFAAGLEKSDFTISVTDNILLIATERKNTEQGNWKRQEYRPGGFERRFELSKKVNQEAISAKYEHGVLILTLPKKEGFETTRQEIEIV